MNVSVILRVLLTGTIEFAVVQYSAPPEAKPETADSKAKNVNNNFFIFYRLILTAKRWHFFG
jgi:hypothetical protein